MTSGSIADPVHSCFVSGHAAFRDMFLVEVNRGCPYGCRFCAAGYVYRPPRQARLRDLQALIEDVSPRKVGLVGTALTDWPDLLPFLHWLKKRGTKFSLSSIRADGVTPDLLAVLREAGLRTLTLALEAPSERLRRAANKHLSVEALLRAVALAGKHGVNHLKFYLIVGWPGETEEDFASLAPLLREIAAAASIGITRATRKTRVSGTRRPSAANLRQRIVSESPAWRHSAAASHALAAASSLPSPSGTQPPSGVIAATNP